MKAQDVMSREVVTVTPDDTVVQAARLMLQRKFSGLPVVDADGSLVGMVTEGDLLRRTETGTVRQRPRWLELIAGPGRLAAEYTRSAGKFVKEVMTHEVVAVNEQTELADIVDLMERSHIKRVPVTKGDRLVGIITRQNLVRALVRTNRAKGQVTDDDTIRDRVVAALKEQPWAPLMFNVIVTNGNVKLLGTILDGRQRGALRALVENVPGVKHIEDELVWIEPMSGTVIEPSAA